MWETECPSHLFGDGAKEELSKFFEVGRLNLMVVNYPVLSKANNKSSEYEREIVGDMNVKFK